MSKFHLFAGLVALTLPAAGNLPAADAVTRGEKVVRLYDGPAPGSENWTQTEKASRTNLWRTRVVFNVANPTLTVFPPEANKANGTAVVICPGGAFFALSIDSEGFDVARALTPRGVTCFVLKYRLVECKTDDPTREVMSRGNLDPVVGPIVKLAMADGLAAVGYVRQHAKEYGVNPARIGIMGFSAGGTVAASVAHNYTPATRPDFVAPIYLAYSWTIKPNGVPADAPPMFILAATDDQLQLASHSVDLYRDWTAAKKPAELHMFAKGGHGFGMRKQNLPTDRWIERFTDWLEMQGWLQPAAQRSEATGQWQAEFDTQIGLQKYMFDLRAEGGKVTGKARSDIGGEKRETELQEGNLDGAQISFVEPLEFQGNSLRITYMGELSGNEIKFTRKVGEFATEQFVAQRSGAAATATPAPARSGSARRPGAPSRIELGPDDKAAFPAAPAVFDQRRENIPHGKIMALSYDSKTVGIQRPLVVYTPPGYTGDKEYPVLYLLHGIGDDEMTWWREGRADAILDDLHAGGKVTPMIVVMANGRADKNMTARTPWGQQSPAFEAFEKELFADVIP